MKAANNKEVKQARDLRVLHARSAVNSFSSGTVSPFMGAYAVSLGASSAEMGWFQATTNVSTNLMQLFWGGASDKLQRRILFVVLGTLIVSALWIPMVFAVNAAQLIVLLALQALLGSMATPAWTALIGDLVPVHRLGRANASINVYASVGSLAATVVSASLMMMVGGTLQGMFLIPFVTAAVFGTASALMMLAVKEQPSPQATAPRRYVPSFYSALKLAKQSPNFARYCVVGGIYVFFMSISWPLLSITQIRVLNASMLQIALLSVVQIVVTIAIQSWVGRLADTRGRKPLLVLFRFALVTVPAAYSLVPDMNMLIGISAFWGIAMALGQASVTAYLLDVSPPEHRGSFVAVYNLISGITSFFGSLLGGYLSNYMTNVYGLVMGLQAVYAVSIIGRTVGAALHIRLKETLVTKL